jgi:hypothetical protein
MDTSIREVTTRATLEEKKKLKYEFFGSQTGNAVTEIVIALLFIWGVTWSAILSLRVGKWLSVFGSYAKFSRGLHRSPGFQRRYLDHQRRPHLRYRIA